MAVGAGEGLLRRGLGVAVGALGVFALVACGGTEVATEASVGDCFQDPESEREVGELEKVDCEEAHDNEVFAVFDLDDGAFPGTTELQALAQAGCAERFEGYVGSPLEESDLEVFGIAPTEETWDDADDREVICAAFAPDEPPLEGTIEDSER